MDKRNFLVMLVVSSLAVGFLLVQRYVQQSYFKDEKPPATQTTPIHAGDTQPSAAPMGVKPLTHPAIAATAPGAATGPSVAVAAPATPATRSSTSAPAAPPSASPPPAAWQVLAPPSAPRSVSLGSVRPDDPNYALQLVLDPNGASFDSVVLNSFRRADDFDLPAKQRRLYEFQGPYASVAHSNPFATQWIDINDVRIDLTGVAWNIDPSDPHIGPDGSIAATYYTTLSTGAAPAIRLAKTFTVYPVHSSEGGDGYEVRINYQLDNLSKSSLKVRTAFNGPTNPPAEGGRGVDRELLAGYREGANVNLVPHSLTEFTKGKVESLPLEKSDKGALSWFGSCSTYFNVLALPLSDNPHATGNAEVGSYVAHVTAQGEQYDDPNVQAVDRPILLTVETTEQTLAAGQSISMPMAVYLGPKWRKVLDLPHYAAIPRHYDATLVIASGCYSKCTFYPLIKLMVLLLTAFHWITGGTRAGSWGVAIILLVGLVRLLLHPITKKSQIQMLKMGKMGPELERLKKKYADDKDELNRQMMQVYKAQGAAPILGCLPMFLQMPIWIALWQSLQSTFELRQAPFLWNLTWIHDLSKPDNLIPFHTEFTLPIMGVVSGINLLPILMGASFFFQQKYMTPPTSTASPEQQQMQKTMQYVTPFIFPVMLYTGPSGLNIYIFASTLFGVIESKIIRKHIQEREEAQKAERVVIDAKPTRQGKQLSRGTSPDEKPGGLRGWWANLQGRVEAAKRDQARRDRDGKRR